MKIPIVTLPQFRRGKLPLYFETDIVEIGYFIDARRDDPKYQKKLILDSIEATYLSYNHFVRDNNNLNEIRNAIQSGDYAIQDNGQKIISQRLITMNKETLSFNNFQQKAMSLSINSSRLEESSSCLEELLNATKLLIERQLKNNIKEVREITLNNR